MPNNQNKLVSRLCYSFGAFGHDIFNQIISTYFIIFVTSNLFTTDNQRYNEYMIGIMTTIILVVRIAELTIDPFIGNTIDKTKLKWGKFKPWVVMGTILSGIAMIILFTDMGGLTANPIIYLIAFAFVYLFMDIFFSFKDIAIWSMLPALSFDSREREKTATYARIGSVFGAQLVTVTVIPIVLYFSNNHNSGAGDSTGWLAFTIIAVSISILGAIAVGLGTKENNSTLRQNKTETSFKKVFSILLKNDQLMWLAFAYLLYGSGAYLLNSLQLYYFTYILGDSTQYSYLGIVNVIIGLLSVSLFPTLAQKFKRRNLFIYCILIMLSALIIFALSHQNLILVLIAAALFSLPQPLIFLVVLMTMTDIVEYGQLKLGHRDESLILSVRPLIDKLSGAVTSGIVGLTAIVAGMSGKATVDTITDTNKFTFQIIMFGIPFICIILSTIIFRKKVTLTEEEHAKIVLELENNWKDIKQ